MVNKKAMSTVVTTVILIALVLVVLAIIWAIISNLIGGQTSAVEIRSRCIEIQIAPIGAECNGLNCNVTVRREVGGGDYDGLMFIFYSGLQSNSTNRAEVLNPLDQRQVTNLPHNLGAGVNPDKVEVRVLIDDSGGNTHICPSSATRRIY